MIIVGIDFGDARTGIAVCDKYEMMATEAGCVHADSYKKALAAVGEKVVELKAELIVVGNPINMDGSQVLPEFPPRCTTRGSPQSPRTRY